MRGKNMTRIRKVLEQIGFIILLILLWKLLYVAGVKWFQFWKSYAVPSPEGVVKSLFSLLERGTLLSAIGQSLFRGIIGFVISVLIGSVIGVVMNHFNYLNRNLKPVILGLQTLPSICWVPFAILWFGLNTRSIIFVVVMGSAFSIAIGVDDAIHNVPPLYIKAAKTMGADKKGLYMKIILPACIPAFISCMKQGWSFAWRALMAGEVMSSTVGLGQTLIIGRDMADINQVMLVMIIIILVGVVIDKGIFTVAERYVLKKRGLQ